MAETEIDGKEFLIGKLTPRVQFHVARRLAPIFAAMASGGAAPSLEKLDLVAMATSISDLKDADADYVLDHCLAVVKHRDGNSTFPITVGNGVFRYDWIDMPMMLRLVGEVIQDNMAGFMRTAPSPSNEVAAV